MVAEMMADMAADMGVNMFADIVATKVFFETKLQAKAYSGIVSLFFFNKLW